MLKLFKRPKLIVISVMAIALLIISVLSLAAEPVFRTGSYIVTNSAILFWLTSIILIIVALTWRHLKVQPETQAIHPDTDGG